MGRKKAATIAAPKSVPVSRARFDTDNGVLTCGIAGGTELTMTFNGLELPVLWRLAMIGALSILGKRRDPAKSWELIRQGIFGRDTRHRKIPLAVRALAEAATMTDSEALKLWRTMGKDERRKVKNDPGIRAVVARLRAESLSQKPGAGDIKQWLADRSAG